MRNTFFMGLSLCAALLFSSSKCGDEKKSAIAEAKGIIAGKAFTDIKASVNNQSNNLFTGKPQNNVKALYEKVTDQTNAPDHKLAEKVNALTENSTKADVQAAQAQLELVFKEDDLEHAESKLKDVLITTGSTEADKLLVTADEKTALIDALKDLKAKLTAAHTAAK